MKNREEAIKEIVIDKMIKRDLETICKDCINGPVVLLAVGGKQECILKHNCLRIYNDGIDKGRSITREITTPIITKPSNDDFEDRMNFVINEFKNDNTSQFINTIGCCLCNYTDDFICKETCKSRKLCEVINDKSMMYDKINKGGE